MPATLSKKAPLLACINPVRLSLNLRRRRLLHHPGVEHVKALVARCLGMPRITHRKGDWDL